jgi:hypothetical protein
MSSIVAQQNGSDCALSGIKQRLWRDVKLFRWKDADFLLTFRAVIAYFDYLTVHQ